MFPDYLYDTASLVQIFEIEGKINTEIIYENTFTQYVGHLADCGSESEIEKMVFIILIDRINDLLQGLMEEEIYNKNIIESDLSKLTSLKELSLKELEEQNLAYQDKFDYLDEIITKYIEVILSEKALIFFISKVENIINSPEYKNSIQKLDPSDIFIQIELEKPDWYLDCFRAQLYKARNKLSVSKP